MLTLAVTYAGLLGGAERTLVDFARGLPGGVVVACPEGPVADRARGEGLTVLPLPARRLELRAGPLAAAAELAGHARDLRRLVGAVQPDLLLTWGMRSTIVAPAVLAGRRSRPAHLVRHLDLLPGPLIAHLVRHGARRAERISVNSAAVANDLDPTGRLRERLSITSPGVDLASFPASFEWEVAPDPEVLVLGAIVPIKRPELALEAVAVAARELPDLRLVLAGAAMGAGGERLLAELRRRASRPDLEGRVRFAGEVDDPRAALSRAWCLLHCADREAFGAVLVQALAAGRPVVAPAIAGPLEVVDNDCGRLYRPGDAQAAARALLEVLGEPGRARALGQAARLRARRFDAERARLDFARVAHEAVRAAGPERPQASGAPPGAGMALVTVTHNSKDEVLTLLRSVARHLPGAHVVVVDSGSEDAGADSARESGLAAQVLELGENVGFGRASNAGVAVVDEPVCALVNPDVELIDRSLASLAAALASGAERILAPVALSPDGSRQDTAQLDPASQLCLLRALVPPTALPAALRRRVDPWRSERARPVGWAVGCCLVARTETLRRLGPFDERIFLFGEDLELGMRAAAAGVETWFCPAARVLHLDAHATGPAFGGEPHELFARRRRAVIGELRGPAAARRDGWTWLLTYADRIALKTLTGRPAEREKRQLAAQWRARKAPPTLARQPAR